MAADLLTSNTVAGLFNYDLSDDDDPFGDIATSKKRNDKHTLSPRALKRKADEDDKENLGLGLGLGLGLDEEVKITKKRKPIAKLDEERLLSQPGIPKLRALARSGQITKKLHLKGRGHEFSDAARLLNYFQLWLDDLYPRAKFSDGLQLVEKVGHSKRMQIMRREWIDEGKPGYARDSNYNNKSLRRETEEEEERGGGLAPRAIYSNNNDPGETSNPKEKTGAVAPRESAPFDKNIDPDALFFPDSNQNKLGPLVAIGGKNSNNYDNYGNDDDVPEDDELDALLAEQISKRRQPVATAKTTMTVSKCGGDKDEDDHGDNNSNDNDDDDDEDDHLNFLQTATRQDPSKESESESTTFQNPRQKPVVVVDSDSDNGDDDLDAILAEQEELLLLKKKNERTRSDVVVSSSINNNQEREEGEEEEEEDDDDDLDALLAEQESRTIVL